MVGAVWGEVIVVEEEDKPQADLWRSWHAKPAEVSTNIV